MAVSKKVDISRILPVSNKCLLKVDLTTTEKEETLESGLIITVSDQDENDDFVFAKVAAVGKGEYNLQGVFTPSQLKVNDVVIVTRFGGSFYRSGIDKYMLCREQDVIGKYDGKYDPFPEDDFSKPKAEELEEDK